MLTLALTHLSHKKKLSLIYIYGYILCARTHASPYYCERLILKIGTSLRLPKPSPSLVVDGHVPITEGIN